MIYTRLTIQAMNFAEQAHRGQVDKAGMPYIFHCYKVAEQAKDEDETAIAFLHDVIEDTLYTENYLRVGFPEFIVDKVVRLIPAGLRIRW